MEVSIFRRLSEVTPKIRPLPAANPIAIGGRPSYPANLRASTVACLTKTCRTRILRLHLALDHDYHDSAHWNGI